MITADTITDEQIRELRDVLRKESGMQMTNDTDACSTALFDLSAGHAPKHERRVAEQMRRLARARCAEILNARAVKP